MTGSPPVSAIAEIPLQVSLMLFGLISAIGTTFGGFINKGTESATTIISSDKAPRPTPLRALSLNL